jgi:hypothetical protein
VTQDTRLAELSLKMASQANLTNSLSKKELAIVSPCSNCQNFTQSASSSSDPFRAACPRRIWIQQQQQNPDDPSAVDPVLSLSGTDDPNKLVNPVVDPTTGNYLIWVAAVEDNAGIADEQGNQVTPGILDPEFNNLYIRCRLFPYVSEQHHDVLRSSGAFQEMDHVVAEQHRVPPMTTPLTNNKIQYTETPVAGTVSRTSFAYHFDTQNPDDHALVGGC